jgi:RimJ/RimL family protein N-acetyltransferase
MKHWTRPDGRCFVVGEPDDELPDGRVHATADEADDARLRRLGDLGFRLHRRELLLRIPTDPGSWNVAGVEPPPGIAFRRADQVDEPRLRLLDDVLRQDVPGTDGWRWQSDDFREETYESPAFDPSTYLVAVDGDGHYVGIARIWMNAERPRLGFVGVRAEWRRNGVARALTARVLAALHERGVPDVRTEVDETNVASRALLTGFGGETVGASLELVREAAVSARRGPLR